MYTYDLQKSPNTSRLILSPKRAIFVTLVTD
jgi:hypothetical protein